MTISILSLHTYPVKSCGGIAHMQAGVSAAGLAYDRQWMVADNDGRFVTQRQFPTMALIQPTVDGTALFLDAPDMPTLRVSLRHEGTSAAAAPLRIWDSDTLGRDEGDTAARWFSNYLGIHCRLYRVHPEAQRPACPDKVAAWLARRPDIEGATGEHIFGFADSFPFLIMAQDSLDDLNLHLAAKGEAPVAMNRFRPNIVIQGMDAYEEDHLSSLQAGPMVFALVRRCHRCPMPNVDPLTGIPGSEPLATLCGYRNFSGHVLFGVHAVLNGAEPGAMLSIGTRMQATLDF